MDIGKGMSVVGPEASGLAGIATAHSLTAIAMALTDADQIDYTAVAQEAALRRVDASIAHHLHRVVDAQVTQWAGSADGKRIIDMRIREALESGAA